MRKLKTIGILAFLATVSCSGGSVLDPVIEPAVATITGTVEIIGAPLASLDDPSLVGVQDDTKWSLKLIDPVEDVDSAVIPVENTTFSPVEVTIAGEYLLSINLQPALDLSGNTATTTPVAVSIPVSVTEGESTQVFATVEVLGTVATSSIHTTSQATGGRLRLRYAVETPGLRDVGFVEIDWNGMQIRHDTNRDDQFDDEEYFADSDRDGISDELRDQMRDYMTRPEHFAIDGILAEIDRLHHRLLVGDSWYRVTERTIVLRHDSRVHLGNLEVGQSLRVTGHKGQGNINYADEIRIMRPAGGN